MITRFVEYANAHSASIRQPKRLRAKYANLKKTSRLMQQYNGGGGVAPA
jgi:hypothetical protein